MYKFPIGIMIDSLKNDTTNDAIEKAAMLGAKGIQMYSTSGVNAPENLSKERRRDLLKRVKDNGLVFSAICGDLGHGFINREANAENVDKSKRIMELAKKLECNIVTTHIGVVPSDPNHDRYKIMQEACFELAEFADSMGSHFAVETGPETSADLKGFLDSLDSTGVGVNLDPANLVMVTGDDPVKAVHNLKKYIVHTHAKDGKQIFYRDPEIVYGIKKDVIVTDDSFIEVPLGEGSVVWPDYLKALEEIGYNGFLTIEREVGDNPEKDIRAAVEFLKAQMR